MVDLEDGDRLERLWAPHRMAYVTTSAAQEGCPFCRIPDEPDGLVVARGETTYAVLNLHPYNPGHLMIVPFRHVGDLTGLTEAEERELAVMTRRALVAIRATSQPHGFNIGLNLGGVAGGSLSEHLHQHVVPRWGGDANFMTVTSNTKVIPQLLEETRALLADAWPSG